jgi:hypothetical protein
MSDNSEKQEKVMKADPNPPVNQNPPRGQIPKLTTPAQPNTVLHPDGTVQVSPPQGVQQRGPVEIPVSENPVVRHEIGKTEPEEEKKEVEVKPTSEVPQDHNKDGQDK